MDSFKTDESVIYPYHNIYSKMQDEFQNITYKPYRKTPLTKGQKIRRNKSKLAKKSRKNNR